jgi:integrase
MLVDSEKNPECKAFLELAWHVGAAQIDLVSLTAENIAWNTKGITYFHCKTGKLCVLRFGEAVTAILRRLPASGSLFPKYSKLCSADRATRFAKRVEKLGIKKRSEEVGIPFISLHSYRYAWAERARAARYRSGLHKKLSVLRVPRFIALTLKVFKSSYHLWKNTRNDQN